MRYFVVLLSILLCGFQQIQAYWPFSQKKSIYEYKSIENVNTKPLSPVIFVPGYGGNQIDAKLHKTSTPSVYCSKDADWFNLWLNLEQIVPLVVNCWVDNFKLYYDNVTKTTHNTPGVETRVPGWGDPEVVHWIDPSHNMNGAYFIDIGNLLISRGYDSKKNIHGAPYDFRKAPNENRQYFIDLKELVEATYEANNQIPITFIAHSMGSPMILVFLQQQTSEWKAKYIARVISLAGAWAGSIKALKVYAMGDDLDSFLLSGKILKEEQISNPSTAWLLPSPLFWGGDEVLVKTPKRSYTMGQLEQFFNDLGFRNGWEMRKNTMRYVLNFNPPDVELHCLYGDRVPTVEQLVYEKDDITDETPTLVMGLGDGTVNRRSLRACKYWSGYQAANITNVVFSGVNHMGILKNKKVLDYITRILQI
ncbi:phospholipase A2 group XV-like [Glossina fuscipes]|uniref:Phospholipase A2 group XV-like n=1 Tax=Glossina fuscipes TaxID=7396 RepID=A0A8U0WD65_9MUSC|nr:phospholipase A2 group XV-like [Glossina fuscipes]